MTALPLVANLAGPPFRNVARSSGARRIRVPVYVVTTAVSTFVTGRSKSLRVALHLLSGALLSGALTLPAIAQDEDPDYSRLIFEVAEIPPDPGTAAGGAGTGVTGAANAGNDSAAGPIPPGAGLPAAEAARNLGADITAYRARISDTLASDNPYSTALREQYDALGTLLQQDGEHEDAIAAFESAMHIDRVNGGLYTLDQIPVVEKMIASHEALGNTDDVNDLHGYLFYIQQRTYDKDDPRLLAAMESWADWNVASYMQEGPRYSSVAGFNGSATLSTGPMDYVAVQNRDGSFSYIPRAQMMSIMNPAWGGTLDPTFMSTYGVDAERVIDERLRTARDYYEQILEAPDAAEGRVQHKLANVAFAAKQQIDGIDAVTAEGSLYSNRVVAPRTRPLAITRGYIDNREALEALAQELEQDPAASAEDKARAWIDLGDWHVGYDNASRGNEAYRKAWEALAAAGLDAAAIEDLFMPQPLVVAPGFVTHPFSRAMYGIAADAAIAWKGHMDLSLDVNRYGDVNGVDITDASPGTPQSLRTELLRYLREAKVRPAVVEGETVKREDVKLRYYYSY